MPDYLFPAVCAAPNWLLHLGFSLGWVGSKTITMDHLFSSLSSHLPFGGIKKISCHLITFTFLHFRCSFGWDQNLLQWITFFFLCQFHFPSHRPFDGIKRIFHVIWSLSLSFVTFNFLHFSFLPWFGWKLNS